jgi:hypothetical protein
LRCGCWSGIRSRLLVAPALLDEQIDAWQNAVAENLLSPGFEVGVLYCGRGTAFDLGLGLGLCAFGLLLFGILCIHVCPTIPPIIAVPTKRLSSAQAGQPRRLSLRGRGNIRPVATARNDLNRDSNRDRLVSAAAVEDDSSFELKLRPQRLNEFIGQGKVKENLAVAI